MNYVMKQIVIIQLIIHIIKTIVILWPYVGTTILKKYNIGNHSNIYNIKDESGIFLNNLNQLQEKKIYKLC